VTSDRTPFIRGSPIGGPTPFTLEAQLVEPVTAWLEAAGYRVDVEVPILGRRADLIGARDDALVAVELKLRDWGEALRQAIAYQLAADRAWIAMPLAAASSAYRQRWRFEAEGVGLLAVDDRGTVRTPVPAGPSPRLLPFLRERILAGPAQSSWEFPQALLVSRPEIASASGSSDL
jgi:hypothetical protein